MALVVMFALAPFAIADSKPGIPGVEPEQSFGCDDCDVVRELEIQDCEPAAPGSGFTDCEAGGTHLCDGSGECVWEPTCGTNRCLLA